MLSCLLLSVATAITAAPVEKWQTSIPSSVSSYVVDYAPIVYLFSGEKYYPADIGAQVVNTQPEINFTSISGAPSPLTLDNLDQLNSIANSNGGQDIYLSSTSDPTTNPRPSYLYGVAPDSNGQTPNAVSAAIVTVENTIISTLDVFYFYFYAFDYGGDYFGLNVGNHVGDWEHNMIRFNTSTSTPISIWYSQHAGGQAFTYDATEKYNSGPRPVTYCANGTHANYATPGVHDHTIPGVNLPAGPIEDHTDAGPVWDPTQAAYYYSYDPAAGAFSAYDSSAPVNWLDFTGHWGDNQLPDDDDRQSCPLGIKQLCQYTGGPTGPRDKSLVRANVCPDGKDCPVYPVLLPRRSAGAPAVEGGRRS